MPRTLKRRAELIAGNVHTNDASEQSSSPQPARRRRRSPSPSSSSGNDGVSPQPTSTQPSTTALATLTKKLIRLALSTSYTRTPLRRTTIRALILNDAQHGRQFNAIFASAQHTLRSTFGMELVELPNREKTSLKDRRAQATQTKVDKSSSSQSYVLVSCLPVPYKTDAKIVTPGKDSEYTGLYTFIVSLIYLNNGSLTEAKLERYLGRVNADISTPAGSLEKLLARMSKEGYVEKKRDTSSGEEVVEWIVGARGRVEVGVKGVQGLVREVYTDAHGTVKEDMHDLDERLERSLGVKFDKRQVDGESDGEVVEMDGDGNGDSDGGDSAADAESEPQQQQKKKRGRPRKGPTRDEDEEEDEDE